MNHTIPRRVVLTLMLLAACTVIAQTPPAKSPAPASTEACSTTPDETLLNGCQQMKLELLQTQIDEIVSSARNAMAPLQQEKGEFILALQAAHPGYHFIPARRDPDGKMLPASLVKDAPPVPAAPPAPQTQQSPVAPTAVLTPTPAAKPADVKSPK